MTLRRIPQAFAYLDDPDLPRRLGFINDTDDEPVKRRKRRPTLASIIRQMRKAGVEVAAYQVDTSTGMVKIIPGKADDPENDGWRDVVLQ